MENRTNKEQTLEQSKAITVADIKATLKKHVPDKFDKMIIDNSQSFVRMNYQYVRYLNNTSERIAKKIEFPLFPDIISEFALLEGGVSRFGEKTLIENESIITKINNHKIAAKNIETKELSKDWSIYPYSLTDKNINTKQPLYFFPDKTYQEPCSHCKTEKYVTCVEKDCLGKHEWVCPRCNGARRVVCDDTTCKGKGFWKCEKCNGKGDNKCHHCGGHGEIRCSACGGDGVIEGDLGGKATGFLVDKALGSSMGVGSDKRCSHCGGKGSSRCPTCRDGFIRCQTCSGKGEIRCEKCSGKGEILCPDCEASGKIVCKKCYGDNQRYGKVDCPICQATAINCYIQFVETIIKVNQREILYRDNDKLTDIQDEQIKKHCLQTPIYELVYFNANSLVESNDEFAIKFCDTIGKEMKLNKVIFPTIIKEEICYETIPCIRISYKHMLTNTIHEISIIDFFSKPEIIFHSEPEEIKKDLKNTLKVAGGLFGKLFKTKTHLTKEDNKTKIKLLIYLAKADGLIEDEEKEHLSNMIGSLSSDFTNSEKKSFYDLMNMRILPDLTNKDVLFSCKENADETFKELENMAMADGTIEEKEKQMIDKMKTLLTIKK